MCFVERSFCVEYTNSKDFKLYAVINSLYMFISTCTYKTFWSQKQYCHTIKTSQGITTNIFHENMQFFRPKLIHYLFWTINRKRYQENNPIEFWYLVFRKPKLWYLILKFKKKIKQDNFISVFDIFVGNYNKLQINSEHKYNLDTVKVHSILVNFFFNLN